MNTWNGEERNGTESFPKVKFWKGNGNISNFEKKNGTESLSEKIGVGPITGILDIYVVKSGHWVGILDIAAMSNEPPMSKMPTAERCTSELACDCVFFV